MISINTLFATIFVRSKCILIKFHSKKMIKLLTTFCSPSIHGMKMIRFIQYLNKIGIKAQLYSPSRWPMGHCASEYLEDFVLEKNDIIINDGFVINNYFQLVNLDWYRFTHGRKNRFLKI